MSLTISRTDANAFFGLFPEGLPHVYNSRGFVMLNSNKCGDMHYLVFADKHARFGAILGERDNTLYSPFSAPFGGFVYNRMQQIGEIEQAVELLGRYGKEIHKPIEIVFPPEIYDPRSAAKFVAAAMHYGRLLYCDLNYHFIIPSSLPEVAEAFHLTDALGAKARPRFRKAFAKQFVVQRLNSSNLSDIARTYAVIESNRRHKGYPLRMTLEQVQQTAPFVGSEFVVMSKDGADVAAAVLYRAAPGIMQVIYWGDAPGYEQDHPMYYFSLEVFAICHNLGARIVDVGPASEGGEPNVGLCVFKEAIGCIPTLKPHFRFE